MPESGTAEFEKWLSQTLPSADSGSSGNVRYELRDPENNRRLQELLSSKKPASDSASNSFVFTTDGMRVKKRHRYAGPGSIRTWYTWELPVDKIQDQNVEDEYHFEISAREAEAPLISDSNSTNDRVEVSLDTFENTPQLIREFRVAGMDEMREAVQDFLQADQSKWGLAPEHGMLLSGKPGTGKTEVVTEVCRELFGAVPVEISGPEILSRWVGESERTLRDRFESAREDPSGVLYIDELDAIARSRGDAAQEHSAQIVAQLLVLLDGLESKRKSEQIKVIASTNQKEVIDEALLRPGRLGRTETFSKLTGDDAVAVLHHYLDEIRYNSEERSLESATGKLSDELESFAKTGELALFESEGIEIEPRVSGKTGAEIEQLIQQATRAADEDGVDMLRVAHIEQASAF